ncbi:hypothetical protein [Demequina zhanjiangensis]|uniref:Uncharacterized protein n=1 Tax=Demequina zhanjiangensis TaxID=3051659 RepID=A0ABT8FY90_9MICO|nr:hypothetical protein [Demequina sp. SYSU T00b26]MDN4471845.1 hypothetical protein [Demequina sp. SYSU T00b26]
MRRWFARSTRSRDWDRKVEAVRAESLARERALVGQEELVARVEELLFRHDPIGINFEENTDEYRAEAQTIVMRLPEAADVDDLRRIVHEEFVRWFDAQVAGPPERYAAIAREIWALSEGTVSE